jgi:stearoyl-CoA desaturase (Delta-9 desaturase)
MFSRIPFHRIHWETSIFLIGTLFLSLTAVPLYLWHFGLDWFQAALFFVMFLCTGLSITLGYHRLFSHLSFKAHWSVRLFTLIFGAAAFENSALMWASEHRRHHKHVDHEEDPYDITKGFFHAHIGWLLFKLKPEPPFDNVPDLDRDGLVCWQHRHVQKLAVSVGFIFPALLGWMWNGASGALGAFLLAGVARVVCVQHCTFFINSACHTVGNRPYSSRCSARDSWLMALFTFGEGYHNYHHEFQHDYRNGVKPWQFDPTKWIIWTLSKLGLAGSLRRVPQEKIILAELQETQRSIQAKLALVSAQHAEHGILVALYERLQTLTAEWEQYRAKKLEITREMLANLQAELRSAICALRAIDLSACTGA